MTISSSARPATAGVVRNGFEQFDCMRRWQGSLLDVLGLGPIQAPFDVVLSEPAIRLRHYPGGAGTGPVLLIIPAPIKRAYIWDLAPGISVVRRCLGEGLRVYLLEWTHLSAAECDFGLADHADRLIGACVDAIANETRECRVSIAGHSIGGTLATIFAALHPGRIRSLVLLESPLHFAEDAGAFAPLVGVSPRGSILRDALGTIPGSFLGLAGFAAAPATFAWSRWLDWLLSAGDLDAIQTHLRAERWMLDELALPGKLFEEILELLYRGDCFARGVLEINGCPATPEALHNPILAVVDPRSSIIPAGSVTTVLDAAPSGNVSVLRYEGDRGVALQHVGVLIGANAHRHLWPKIVRWLRDVVALAEPGAPSRP